MLREELEDGFVWRNDGEGGKEEEREGTNLTFLLSQSADITKKTGPAGLAGWRYGERGEEARRNGRRLT